MRHILTHFKRVDPKLSAVIRGDSWMILKRNYDHFTGLCRIITSQQVSTKAAAAIFERFCGLFPHKKPTAVKVLALSEQELRSAGLSSSKINSIRDLARHIAEKELDLKNIEKREDEEIRASLIKVKGIGPWSAEMFLIFYLGREDIFSPGDLGLRTAIMKLYRKKKLPSPEASAKMARRWSPYRSYACRILWESLNNNPSK